MDQLFLILINLQKLFYFFLKTLMSQSKLSKSKTKTPIKYLPSADILHKGYQRKMAQSEYIKIFPKMKLRLNGRSNPISIMKNEYTQEYIWQQVQNMKEENKKLEEANQELIVKIRKQSKFNEIYEKKMDKVPIDCMPFEKILEIKLLLEVEELEQTLSRKEEEVDNLLKINKKKKESITNSTDDPYIELHAVLLNTSKQVEHRRQSQEIKLKQTFEILDSLSQKRQKLKNKYRQKGNQLNNTKLSLSNQNLTVSTKQEVIQQNNQNILGCAINRTKNIEDLQTEIQRIQQEQKELEVKLQHQIDGKVKEKLQLMRQMQQCNNKLQKLKYLDKNRSIKVVDW